MRERPILGRKFKISTLDVLSSRCSCDHQEAMGLELGGTFWGGNKGDMNIQGIYKAMGVGKIVCG